MSEAVSKSFYVGSAFVDFVDNNFIENDTIAPKKLLLLVCSFTRHSHVVAHILQIKSASFICLFFKQNEQGRSEESKIICPPFLKGVVSQKKCSY